LGGTVALGRAAVPYRAVRMAGVDAASANPHDNDTLKLEMRLAIAISN
jgi:hypothetical protein